MKENLMNQPNQVWMALTTADNKTHLCQLEMLPQVVPPGNFARFIAYGDNALKIGNYLISLGITDFNKKYVDVFLAQKGQVGRPAKKIICNETKVVYKSINEAARAIGSGAGNISSHLRYPQAFKTVKGFTFNYFKGI